MQKRLFFFQMFTFFAICSIADGATNSCYSLFYSNNDVGHYLKSGINSKIMSTSGFQIINLKPLISDYQAKQLLDLMPTVGTPKIQYYGADYTSPVVSHEIRILRGENGSLTQLEALPQEIGRPIIKFIEELTKELNRKLASTEGEMQFSFGLIRDFSRNDLIDDFHQHQNGHISMSVSLYGPGTVIPINQKSPNLNDVNVAKTNQLVVFTDGQRARKLGIPSTLHGSPKLQPGQQRLVLLIHMELKYEKN